MIKVIEKINKSIDVYSDSELLRTFMPNMNYDNGIELLKEFNCLSDTQKQNISSLWAFKNYYFYPSIQEWIYADLILGRVMYSDLWQFLKNREFKIIREDQNSIGNFEKSYNFLYKKKSFLKKVLLNIFSSFNFSNRIYDKILVIDDGPNGFRYEQLKEKLSEICNYIIFEKLNSIKSIINFNIFKKFYFGKSKLFYDNLDYEIQNKSKIISKYFDDVSFQHAIDSINYKCQDLVYQSRYYEKIIRNNKPKALLCYDQIETAIPIVVAFKINNIEVFSFQHGPITKYHAGWIGYNIDNKYCNIVPNKIIVWGTYWHKFLLSISNKYNHKNIEVGPHLNKKIKYDEDIFNKKHKNKYLKFLLPYEFLADNYEISKFLEKLIENNCNVTIKLRPNGNIKTDPLSFSKLVRQKCKFVKNLTDHELKEFDIVLYTQSIFALEMMRFATCLWYLDTPMSFLRQTVNDGFAHDINLSNIDEILKNVKKNSNYYMRKYTFEDYKSVFSNISLGNYLLEKIDKINE